MSRIVQGARDALTMAKGEADPNDYVVNIPETIDVRRIRKKLGMAQAAFAGIFLIPSRNAAALGAAQADPGRGWPGLLIQSSLTGSRTRHARRYARESE